jgi:hypothetical protein
MPLVILDNCYDTLAPSPNARQRSTIANAEAEARKHNVHEPDRTRCCMRCGQPVPEQRDWMTWTELLEYLNNYGHNPAKMRVVMSSTTMLGPHGFDLTFQDRLNGEWRELMNGGAVYTEGKGWTVHS